jgi:hypothetical protein
MEKLSLKPENFYLDVIKKAFFLILTGVAGYIVSLVFEKINPGLTSDVKSIIVGGFIIVGALVISSARFGVRYFSNDIGKKYMKSNAGIIDVYSNLEACRAIIRADFQKASNIRLLLQIGRRELGDEEPSFFWSIARDTKSRTNSVIKILRASEESPFLSKDRAKFRNDHVEQWQEDIRRLDKSLQLLKDSYHVNFEARQHVEPYLWRIFIFDDIAYVSAYLYSRANDTKAVVYRIQKGDNSLYSIFSKYFDYLWLKYDPSGPQDEIQKWSTWVG